MLEATQAKQSQPGNPSSAVRPRSAIRASKPPEVPTDRPFSSVWEVERHCTKAWRASVTDTLICLGGIESRGKTAERLDLLRGLRANAWLVVGIHDVSLGACLQVTCFERTCRALLVKVLSRWRSLICRCEPFLPHGRMGAVIAMAGRTTQVHSGLASAQNAWTANRCFVLRTSADH